MKSKNKLNIPQVNDTKVRKSDDKQSGQAVGQTHSRGQKGENEMINASNSRNKGYYSRNGYGSYNGL